MDITYSFMIPVLEYFHKVTSSYGWAIMLLTLAVRILVWPLVAKSTKSMMKMSQLQPQVKAIQERYKDNPELFQKKTMEFYTKNKINPMGGCLPTLVQLPILFALFATFTGPPFGDKPIDVKVNVVDAAPGVEFKRAETSSANSPYVSPEGQTAKVVVFPGEMTIKPGESVDFGTRAVEGKLPEDFKPVWKIVGPKPKEGEPSVSMDDQGHATFPRQGEFHVQAVVPGVAKQEKFAFINGLGKTVQGVSLLKPDNWDALSLILLFGITMYLSSKFSMAQSPSKKPDSELNEQEIIQRQTMKTMPIAVTAMFFFIPLPTGVYLYMVVSNIIQTLQTWMIMKSPAPAIVDVLDDGPPPPPSNGAGPKRKDPDQGTAQADDKPVKALTDNKGGGSDTADTSDQGAKIKVKPASYSSNGKRKKKKK